MNEAEENKTPSPPPPPEHGHHPPPPPPPSEVPPYVMTVLLDMERRVGKLEGQLKLVISQLFEGRKQS